MDVTLRTDRQIATLLDFVNTRVGLTNTLIAFTADHGVSPIPEQAKEPRFGRRALEPHGFRNHQQGHQRSLQPGKVAGSFCRLLVEVYPGWSQCEHFINGNIYFNYDALRRDGVSVEEFFMVIAGALTFRGVARAFSRIQLMRGATSITDPIERRVLHGFYPARSGDVVIVPEPSSIWAIPSPPHTAQLIHTTRTSQRLSWDQASMPGVTLNQQPPPTSRQHCLLCFESHHLQTPPVAC